MEVIGVPGRTMEACDPIFGDHLAMPVHWRGQSHIGVPEGQPVALRFKLRAAKVFGLEWV